MPRRVGSVLRCPGRKGQNVGYKVHFKGKYIGFYSTYEDARQSLRKRQPATADKKLARRPVRHFADVHPYKANAGEWKWKVWSSGAGVYQYGYDKELEAAQAAAKHVGVTAEELK